MAAENLSVRSTRRIRALSFLLAAAFIVPHAARGAELVEGPVQLDADQGEIVHADCPAPPAPGAIAGAFRLLELRGGGRWAPSAFIGIRDDARRGKFRVFITQPERGGALIAGFDYVLDDTLVLREAVVKNIPRTAAVRVDLTWDGAGKVTVAFFGKTPRTVQTELSPGVLFAAASAAKAKFVLSAEPFL